ncbi:oligosaccharide flippase family protein [Aliarcobacter butzleri]|uniref:oligosaccharide flippase family protein n=1 Tax=Aliarcobacter butzleri TaxID=28197 RepID=UPI001866372E|nr:oligosaccharide flippase family protein [Aliarcobacter butzleri]
MLNKLKPKSEFSRNILTLMTGTTIAQAIPIAISPILTRIYTPEDFGIFALFIAVTSIFGSIASGRYELAIMLPKKDEDAVNIFVLGLIITCFITIILFILMILFNDYLTKLLGNEEISFWLYFVPLTVFFTGLWNLLNYYNNRKKNYKDIANAIVVKSIVLVIFQLIVGLLKHGVIGLIVGQIISQIIANFKLLKNIYTDKKLILSISKLKIRALSRRYISFPKHNMIPSMLDNLTSQLIYIIIPKIFSLLVSGQFFLANRIVNLPVSLMSNSISQVYLQKISENKNKKIKNMDIFISTIKKLFIIALPIGIAGFFLSPNIFLFIFGKEWIISGEIAQYLFLIFLVTFCISPLSVSFIPSMDLKKSAYWQYLYFCTSTLFFLITLYLKLDLKTFLIFFVIHEYVLYGIYLYLIILTIRKMDNNIKE